MVIGILQNGGVFAPQLFQDNPCDSLFNNEFVFVAHKAALVASIILGFVLGPTLPVIFSVSFCLIYGAFEIANSLGCLRCEDPSDEIAKAILVEDLGKIAALHQQGFDLNQAHPVTGKTPLYQAVDAYSLSVVNCLLQKGVVVPKIGEHDPDLIPLIIRNIEQERDFHFHLDIALRLFEAVTVNGETNTENYLIAEAIHNAYLKSSTFVDYLQDESIERFTLLREMFFDILSKDRIDSSPDYLRKELLQAIADENLARMKALCQPGFDLNAVDPATGETFLYVACRAGKFLSVGFLLDNGAVVPKIGEQSSHPILSINFALQQEVALDVPRLNIAVRLFKATNGIPNSGNEVIAKAVHRLAVKFPALENHVDPQLIESYRQMQIMFFARFNRELRQRDGLAIAALETNPEQLKRVLFDAILDGDLHTLELYCKRHQEGCPPGLCLNHLVLPGNETCLSLACKNGLFPVVDLLLRYNVVLQNTQPILSLVADIEKDVAANVFNAGKVDTALRLWKANYEWAAIAETIFKVFARFPNFEKDLRDQSQGPLLHLKSQFYDSFGLEMALVDIHGMESSKTTRSPEFESLYRKFLRKCVIEKSLACDSACPSKDDFNLVVDVLSGQDPSIQLVETSVGENPIHVVIDKSGYMVVCHLNGELPPGKRPFETYQIDFKKVTPQILQKLGQIKQAPPAEALKYIYTELPDSLASTPPADHQDGVCKEIRAFGLAPKKPKSQNEYWRSLKGAIKAVVALKKLKAGLPVKTAVQFAKEFSTAMREYILMRCETRLGGRSRQLPSLLGEAGARLFNRKCRLKLEPDVPTPALGLQMLFHACQTFDWPLFEYLQSKRVQIPKMANGQPHPLTKSFVLLQADLQANICDLKKVNFLLQVFNLLTPDETKPSNESMCIACDLYELSLIFKGTLKKSLGDDTYAIFSEMKRMYFSELFQRRVAGLINGIKNIDLSVRYEGSNTVHAQYLHKLLIKHCLECAKESPAFAQDFEGLATVLKEKDITKPFIMKAGFTRHVTHLVFHPSGYLVVSNPGAGRYPGKTTLETFVIDFKKVTRPLIDGIWKIKADNRSDAEFFTYAYHDLPQILSPGPEPVQDEVCNAMKTIARRTQDVGNCYWASLKGATRAVIALNRMAGHRDDKAQLEKEALVAKRLSKHLSTQARQKSMDVYAKHSAKNPRLIDKYLIGEASKKIVKRQLLDVSSSG